MLGFECLELELLAYLLANTRLPCYRVKFLLAKHHVMRSSEAHAKIV